MQPVDRTPQEPARSMRLEGKRHTAKARESSLFFAKAFGEATGVTPLFSMFARTAEPREVRRERRLQARAHRSPPSHMRALDFFQLHDHQARPSRSNEGFSRPFEAPTSISFPSSFEKERGIARRKSPSEARGYQFKMSQPKVPDYNFPINEAGEIEIDTSFVKDLQEKTMREECHKIFFSDPIIRSPGTIHLAGLSQQTHTPPAIEAPPTRQEQIGALLEKHPQYKPMYDRLETRQDRLDTQMNTKHDRRLQLYKEKLPEQVDSLEKRFEKESDRRSGQRDRAEEGFYQRLLKMDGAASQPPAPQCYTPPAPTPKKKKGWFDKTLDFCTDTYKDYVKPPISGTIDVVTDAGKLAKEVVTWGDIEGATGRLIQDAGKPITKPLQWFEDQTGTKIQFSDDVEIPVGSYPLGEPKPKNDGLKNTPVPMPREATSLGEGLAPVSSSLGQVSEEEAMIDKLSHRDLPLEEYGPKAYIGEVASPGDGSSDKYSYDPNTDILNMFQERGVKVGVSFAKHPLKPAYKVGKALDGDNPVGDTLLYTAEQFIPPGAKTTYKVAKHTLGFYNDFYLDYLPKLEKENPAAYQELRDTMNVTTSFHPAAKLVDMVYGPDGPIRQYQASVEKSWDEVRQDPDKFYAESINSWVNTSLASPETIRQMAPVIEQLGIENELDARTYRKVFGKDKP